MNNRTLTKGLIPLCCALALLSVTNPAQAVIDAGPMVNPTNGRKYYLLSPTTWGGAVAQADILGGHLVTINDVAENAWVWTAFDGYPGPYWIGLHFDAGLGGFAWSNGEPLSYLNWAPGEPNDLPVPPLAVTMEPDWRDDHGLAQYRAVVEVPFAGCPLTGTWIDNLGGVWSLLDAGGSVTGLQRPYLGHYSIAGGRANSDVSFVLEWILPAGSPFITYFAHGFMTTCDDMVLGIGFSAGNPLWWFNLHRNRPTYCGDGMQNAGEPCDDGDFDPLDTCDCMPAPTLCGNGTQDPGEPCDDGNAIDKDPCLSSCTLNVCGDGHVNIGIEVCDDGNTTDGDGCGTTCILEPETATGPSSVSTGSVVTSPSDPIGTIVEASGGTLTITEQAAPPNATSGFLFAGTLVQITGVNVIPPITILFGIDSSVLPPGQSASTLEVRKDGVVLDPCNAPGVSPPCVSLRADVPWGVLIEIRTLSLSDFDFRASVCGQGPMWPGCQPAPAGAAHISLAERGADDRLKWIWKNGQQTPASLFGDPTDANDYTLCVYDATGRRLQVTAPAAGTCDGKDCWTATRKGFKYGDKLAAANGIRKLTLKSGDVGKAKLLLKAAGPQLMLPQLPFALPVTAQLRSRDGVCWEALFTTFKDNDTERFTAINE